jgi:hypothetical protein
MGFKIPYDTWINVFLYSADSHNVLDASAPVKRGKERETPKLKKPSPLKKVSLC